MKKHNILMTMKWMRRIQTAFTKREILLMLNKIQCNFGTSVCLAIMVDTAEIEDTNKVDVVELMVVLASAGALVAASWIGYASLYYYILPALVMCLVMFLCRRPHDDIPSIRDEAELMGQILSTDMESLLDFYSLVHLRATIPDIYTRISLVTKKNYCDDSFDDCLLTRDIVIYALYRMEWLDLCTLLSPQYVADFRKMIINLKIPDKVEKMLADGLSRVEYATFRRIALILAMAREERYPATHHAFIRKGWNNRIASVLT
jgi:hypothetical protein